MRFVYTGLLIVVIIHTGARAAQSQPSTQARPASQDAASPVITVTGCLQPGAADAAGAVAAQFVLNNVIARVDAEERSPNPTGAAGGGRPNPASGAVGTAGSEKSPSRYILHGRHSELAKHAGQRVEIVGTASVAPPAPAGAPDAEVIPHEPQRGPVSTVASPDGATQPDGATPPASAHPSVQHLSVQSLRMVSASCQ